MQDIQGILLAAAAGLFLWFLAPVAAGGRINIGNVTGWIAAGLLFLYGIWITPIQKVCLAAWNQREGRALLSVCITVAGVALLFVIAETACMLKALCNRPKKPVTAVVLGCSVKGTRPCTILIERMDAAAVYLKKNPQVQCILSGGQGEGEAISEAECMYRYLVGQGIAPKRLIKEDCSVNTRENLMFARDIMQARGMDMEIAVITSGFHAYRGKMIAEDAGFTAYSVPARTYWLYLAAYYVRELYGILYYWLFVRENRRTKKG